MGLGDSPKGGTLDDDFDCTWKAAMFCERLMDCYGFVVVVVQAEFRHDVVRLALFKQPRRRARRSEDASCGGMCFCGRAERSRGVIDTARVSGDENVGWICGHVGRKGKMMGERESLDAALCALWPLE